MVCNGLGLGPPDRYLTGVSAKLALHAAPAVAVRRVYHQFSMSEDRKSTRLNSSHTVTTYAVFCLKKKKKKNN